MNHELQKTCAELRRAGADGAVLGSVDEISEGAALDLYLIYDQRCIGWSEAIGNRDE